jgi:hypothetical protein
MKNAIEECYFCGAPATSREHVPPKCLFPEEKYTPGKNYRNDLITVPSCKLHNSKKSKDDEYFVFVLTANIQSNSEGQQHFIRSVVKGLERSPYIVRTFIKEPKPILVQTNEGIQDSISFSPDHERMNKIVEHITRALYYYHYKTNVKNSEFQLIYYSGVVNNESDNSQRIEFESKIKQLSSGIPYCGCNTKIFRYKHFIANNQFYMIMEFYEGFSIVSRICSVIN